MIPVTRAGNRRPLRRDRSNRWNRAAVGIEAIITFFLMLVAMSTATDRRVNRGVVGLAIGLTITFGGFFAGPLSGESRESRDALARRSSLGVGAGRGLGSYWRSVLGAGPGCRHLRTDARRRPVRGRDACGIFLACGRSELVSNHSFTLSFYPIDR